MSGCFVRGTEGPTVRLGEIIVPRVTAFLPESALRGLGDAWNVEEGVLEQEDFEC